MTGEPPRTEELEAVQIDRLEAEREAAREAEQPAEERAHGRRADKAAYLADKLREQAEADEER